MVAINATALVPFAFANNPAALHKGRAFQASSPKNFQAVLLGGFFLFSVAQRIFWTENLPYRWHVRRKIGAPRDAKGFRKGFACFGAAVLPLPVSR